MTSLSEQQKWAGNALGTKGFCTLTPASIQIRELAESGGRWKPSLFDQTVVMTSSRSSNLLLKSPNTVEIPHGVLSEYVNYSVYIEKPESRKCQ